MKIISTKKHDYISEALKISQTLKNMSEATGTASIMAFFTIYTISILQIKQLLLFFNLNSGIFTKSMKFSLSYLPLLVFLYFSNKIILKSSTIKYKYIRKLSLWFLNSVFTYLLLPIEFVIFPLKIVIFAVFLSSKTLRVSFISEGVKSYFYLLWVILDIILSLGIVEIKVGYLRGFCPKGGFFSKIDGIFEEIISIVFPIVLILSIFEINPENSPSTYWIFFITKALLLLGVELVYLGELPYFSGSAERVFGHILSLFVVFMTILGVYRRDLNTALKLWCFIIPFQVVCFEFYLKRVYQINFLKNRRKTNLLVIKKILSQGYNNKSTEEKIFDFGVFKNHLLTGKSIDKQYLKIWKIKSKLKNKGKEYEKLGSREELNGELKVEDDEENKINFDEEECSKLIFTQINKQVLEKFIKDSKESNYSYFVKIIWMLDNSLIVNEILKSLSHMTGNSKSLKSQFLYKYAKSEVEKKLKGYYFHKDIYFNKTREELKNKKIIKIEQELKKINDVGVDLAYAFRYKEKVEEMVKLIEEYIQANKKYMTLLGTQSKSLKELNDLCAELYSLKAKIDYSFDQLNSQTRNVEATHLTPYFYFLIKCVNLHRSASKVFKIYKQRMINRRNLIDEKLMILKDVNLFSQSLILMVESQKKGFGMILDVYGDTRYLKIKPLELKGKHMDCLIMESHRAAHTASCEIFNKEVMSPIIGDTVKSFIKLPASDTILPVTYNIKIIPYQETDFKYVVGIKYNRADSRMYILLNQSNKIDCFSYNMKYVFKKAEEYLDRKRSLENFSKTTFDKVNQFDLEGNLRRGKSDSVGSTNQVTNQNTQKKKTKNLVSEYDSKPSLSNYGSQVDKEMLNSQTGFLAKFSFKNIYKGDIINKFFNVRIESKEYIYGNFNYKVLTLEVDDESTKNNILEIKKKQSSIEESKKEKEKEKEASEFEFEEDEEELPALESDRIITNSVRGSHGEFKFMKERNSASINSTENKIKLNGSDKKNKISFENNPVIIESKAEHEDYVENEEDKNYLKVEKEKNILDEISIFENKKINIEVSEIDNTENEILKDMNGINKSNVKSEIKTFRSDQSQGYNEIIHDDSEILNEKFEVVNSLEEDEFDEDKNFSDLNRKQKMIEGTGSVFSNSNIQTHKKYFAFEDAVNKTAGLMETLSIIVLYFLGLAATIFFTIYIQAELKVKNLEFETGNDIYTSFCEHTLESQMFYNKLLSVVAYNKGIYSVDR